MSRIPGTLWDDEAFPDRVDVIRNGPGQDSSGVSRPVPITIVSGQPCSIQYGAGISGGSEQVTGQGDVSSDRVVVGFPVDLALRPGDLLEPRPPSVGSRIRVALYRYIAETRLYTAIGSQVS